MALMSAAASGSRGSMREISKSELWDIGWWSAREVATTEISPIGGTHQLEVDSTA